MKWIFVEVYKIKKNRFTDLENRHGLIVVDFSLKVYTGQVIFFFSSCYNYLGIAFYRPKNEKLKITESINDSD